MLQPFYDGNHRVVFLFIDEYLRNKGYVICLDRVFDDYMNHCSVVPIFYDRDEDIIEEDIVNFKRYIRKKGNYE